LLFGPFCAGRLLPGLALAVFLCISSLIAQQAPLPQSATPATLQPESPLPAAVQQPTGAGTQLETGTSSGLDTDARIANLLADHQFPRIAAELGKLPAGEAQFYRGILANRSNDLQQSVELLAPLAEQAAAGGDADHEKLLRKALAEDYLRLGDWAQAAQAYQTLDARLHAQLSTDEQDEIELPLKLLPLAKDHPPMTVEPCDPFKLQVSTNPLNLLDIPVFVDARPRTWMLDPTAPFNLIARSTAKESGLKLSLDTATIHTLTGKPIQVHSTVIPRFTVGGRLTFRNVTAFVYDDADFAYAHSGYRVEGVLGLPALMGLGSLTVNADSTIEIRPAKQLDPQAKDDRLTAGAPFYLDGEQVVVALGRARPFAEPAPGTNPALDDDRMYVIDAAGQQTYLTSRYFDEHAAEFNAQKVELYAPPGQSAASQPSYVAETVPFIAGGNTIDLHFLRVLTQPVGSAALDDVYGILGVDALQQLRSYTFDYRTMRFSATAE
jgi:hypothetical protein